MKLRSKEPYWLLKNGLVHSYPSLSKNLNCNILIIGGGITGALMAYQLSKEGYSTVLLDKRDIGAGSTSATTAMIQYEIDEPLHTLIKKVGKEAAVDSYKAGVKAMDTLQEMVQTVKSSCSFQRKQSLYVSSSPDDNGWLQDEFYCRKEHGLDVSWLDHVQLQNEFGVVGCGAILSEAAASLDAYRFTHELIDFSVKNLSLKVFDHTEIVTIDYQPKGCIAHTDSGFQIECRHIVHASGYESKEFLKNKKVKLLSTYAFVSERLDALPSLLEKAILWNTEDPYLYFRGTADNRILVGGADEDFKNPLKRDALIDKKESFLLEKFSELVPNINIIPDFAWAGTFGKTPDGLPYIGAHPDFPNSFFVLGYGGNGITFSVMGMQMISDALAGKQNKFLEYFKFDR